MAFDASKHLTKLKGKDYLEVKYRIQWVRDQHPDWCIDTSLIDYDKDLKHAIFRAEIKDSEGKLIASATGSESAKDFGDFIEKAETKSIGRALAYAGFGTQFTADELEEGERIVDAPVEQKKADRPVGTITDDQMKLLVDFCKKYNTSGAKLAERYNHTCLADMSKEEAEEAINKFKSAKKENK